MDGEIHTVDPQRRWKRVCIGSSNESREESFQYLVIVFYEPSSHVFLLDSMRHFPIDLQQISHVASQSLVGKIFIGHKTLNT